MLRTDTEIRKNRSRRKLPSGRCVKFPGLVNDAFELGVHRNTLYLALSGKRTGRTYKEVLVRYNQLKGGK